MLPVENQRKSADKKSFWDILKESSKGLGILFPSDSKTTPRPVRTKLSSNEVTSGEEKPPTEEYLHEVHSEEESRSPMKQAAEGIQEMRNTLHEDLGLAPEVKDLPMLWKRETEASLNEETKKYFREVERKLEEIQEMQVRQSQENSMTPAIVENALEKLFYWVQEKENKQVEENLKEAEQRLNSGQLEILMELRTLVDQTNQVALAEEKILHLENQVAKGKKRGRLMLGFLLVFVLGVAGFAFWLWLHGGLVLRTF